MEAFINESSLHGQYDVHSLKQGIKTFLSIINIIHSIQIEKKIYKTQLFFNVSQAIRGTHLGGLLSNDRGLQQVFFNNLRSAKSWEEEKLHSSNATYIYDNVNYVEHSIAELTERRIQNAEIKGLLINFTNSIFGEKILIQCIKDKAVTTSLDCSFDEDSINDWLIQNGFIDPREKYNEKSGNPPQDWQTVLCDAANFELTQYRNQRRRVFRRLGKNQLWVVDRSRLHAGDKAHIEVFNESTREHLGTSLYNQINLDTRFRENGRTINLDS